MIVVLHIIKRKDCYVRNSKAFLLRMGVVEMLLIMHTGCIEISPLVQGGREGSLSTVTNTIYHGCAYKDDLWESHWSAGGDRVHALYSVRAKYNWWYALAAVCSFGIYMPLDLEWRYDLGKEQYKQ